MMTIVKVKCGYRKKIHSKIVDSPSYSEFDVHENVVQSKTISLSPSPSHMHHSIIIPSGLIKVTIS